MTYVLEIEAEGLPRLVGPFASRDLAEVWAAALISNGSWNIAPLSDPFPPLPEPVTHSAVYCPEPECGAKVKFEYPPGRGEEGLRRRMNVAMAAHWAAAGHPVTDHPAGA